MAMASEWITADMVESMEFPHLANRYQVHGVPRSVINDVIHVEGAVPESALLSKLLTVELQGDDKIPNPKEDNEPQSI
jgi:predicted DsbA family dithiol-disulfide isomerase